jgi:hypothetical protein
VIGIDRFHAAKGIAFCFNFFRNTVHLNIMYLSTNQMHLRLDLIRFQRL